MLGELAVKFLLGGCIVALFSASGEVFKPKTFSGMFGAAPSVALASLALAFSRVGPAAVAVEGRSMVTGAIAMAAYGAACVAGTKREAIPVWVSASVAWAVWFGAAVLMWKLGAKAGVVQ